MAGQVIPAIIPPSIGIQICPPPLSSEWMALASRGHIQLAATLLWKELVFSANHLTSPLHEQSLQTTTSCNYRLGGHSEQ